MQVSQMLDSQKDKISKSKNKKIKESRSSHQEILNWKTNQGNAD